MLFHLNYFDKCWRQQLKVNLSPNNIKAFIVCSPVNRHICKLFVYFCDKAFWKKVENLVDTWCLSSMKWRSFGFVPGLLRCGAMR